MEVAVREDSGLFLVLDFLRNKGIMLYKNIHTPPAPSNLEGELITTENEE